MVPDHPHCRGDPPPAELTEDVDTVRAMYQALEEEDARVLSCILDPRVVWVDPLVSRLPFDGVCRGLPSVLRAAFRRGAYGTGPRLSAGAFLEMGDGVLVAGRFLTDNGAGEPFLHECFVKDGRVARVCGYPA